MNDRYVKVYLKIAMAIFAMLLFMFVAFFGWIGQSITNIKYRVYGKEATGIIFDKQIRTQFDPETNVRIPHYYLKVEYVPGKSKKKFKFEVQVSAIDYQNFKRSDGVLVEYLNPKKATGRVYREPDNVELMILLGSIFAIIGSMVFLKIKGDKDEAARDRERTKYRIPKKKPEK